MEIFLITENELEELAGRAADFRVALKALKDIHGEPNVSAGKAEPKEYIDSCIPVFAAKRDGVYGAESDRTPKAVAERNADDKAPRTRA